MGKQTVEEASQWLMIGPDSIFDSEDKEKRVLCKLPHPKNGFVSLFLFQETKMFEVIKFEDKFRSWLVEDSVQSDGSLHLLTTFDPIFLIIPYLRKAVKEGRYMQLEDILVDSAFPSLRHLEKALSHEALLHICSSKQSADILAYKLDEEKLLAWLKRKVENTAKHLSDSNTIVKPGMSANFVHTTTQAEYLRAAHEFVSDYISNNYSVKLKDSLGIKDKENVKETAIEPPSKKQKIATDGVQSGGDYRADKSDSKPAKKVPVKRTVAQAKLDKVDKKGMKNMSSFFGSKK